MDRRICSSSPRINALARFIVLSTLLFFGHSASLVASPGISLVQHRSKDAGTNTTASVAFSSPNTAGNFIAVAIRGGLSSSQIFTVKDSNGNIYKKAVQIGFTSSAVTAAVYYAENIKGGANTITVSMSVSAPLRFAILEYSGVAASNSLDANAAGTGIGTAVGSGNATTTINGDLLFGSASTVNGATYTAGTGYTIRDSVPSGGGAKFITEDRIQASAGTASATATLAASDGWGALLAAFKPAGGVAAPSITSLNPTSGPVGTSVTITGLNFSSSQGTSTVTFNGNAATPTSWSASSIVVPVPNAATTGNVIVTVSGVASNGALFTVIVPPSITNLSPTFAPLGASVTISGSNFGASQGTSTVTFNGVAATPTSWSTTSITAPVPNGATTGNVVVTVSGLASNGVAFRVAPSITSISPASGPIGTSVTITGTSFGATQGTSTVTFGPNTATPTSWSDTTIVVPVPAGATTGNVIVMVNGIGSNRVLFTVSPTITSLNPTSGPVGTSVTITGSSFASTQGSSTVTFNGTAATPTSWSATSIVAPVPTGATTGNVVVTVGGFASNGAPFTVTVPPNISSLNPTSGAAGVSVTIIGTNFGASQGASTVTFNGTSATPTSWGAAAIAVPVPTGATTGNVVVTVSGLASNGVLFTVPPPPTITSLNPTSGPVNTRVTIAGSNFGTSTGASTVTFNGTLGVISSADWTPTSIVALVPRGATSGNVVVTVGGFASNGLPFTVTVPPNIFVVSPNNGPVGTSVQIGGSNFGASQGTSTVTFNGTTATPTSWSDTQIVVPVPSGATTGNIVVTVAGLTASGGFFTVTPPPPAITSLTPAGGVVGTSVTITGSAFGASQGNSTVTFNGTTGIPTSWRDTSIVVPVPSSATTGNVVVTVGGIASNGVNFTVAPPPPPQSITTLSPSSAVLGGGPLTITVTGTNFVSSSAVQWNGSALATTFLSSTQLQATVTSTNLASLGAAKVTVSNASVGGGVSNASTFFVGTSGGSNFATIVMNQTAQDIVYDPLNQVFYLSIPSTATTNPNTIAVLDPATATITSTQPTGNNPNVLAVSDDSQFLYAGIDGISTVQRFVLPGLAPDISYSLGSDPYSGPYVALDVQVAPGAPHTSAVTLGVSSGSPRALGGITIFDDSTPRPTKTPGFGGTGLLFDSLQWGADANTLFASNAESTSSDFYTLAVNSSGVTLNHDFQSTFTHFGANIHFDAGTNLVYSDDGHAINPTTGLPFGNFNMTGAMAADATLNTAFFASSNTISSFDLTHFTPISAVPIPGLSGTPSHLIRWGQNGLAFINKNSNGTSQIVILGGDFVSTVPPFVVTPPPAPVLPPVPAPNAPTIASLNPSSAIAGSAAFVLNVIGTQFDPAATVQFNGTALSTTYVSSTQLQALIPASSVTIPGAASVLVANPPASGGSSSSATLFVGSGGGTSSAGTGFAFQVVNQVSNRIALDPVGQRLYLSVPNSVATGNTIAVLDPATATIVGQQYAGSNPNVLTISDDGQYLYAGIDGSSSVQRFTLPGLGTDINYSLGAGPNYNIGPYFALDLQAAPGSPHTSGVTLGAWNSSPAALGGIEIFDDTTARQTIAKGFGPGGGGGVLYDSIQWGSDATVLFAADNESTGFDFYTLSVTPSGVSLASDFLFTFSGFSNTIHFDRGTNLVYSDDGHVVVPSTGASAGTFPITGLTSPIMVPDSSLNLAFFAAKTGNSTMAIYSYNLSTFTPVSSIFIPNVFGNPIRLIRWGQNGLAFNTDAGQIVLLGGNFIH